MGLFRRNRDEYLGGDKPISRFEGYAAAVFIGASIFTVLKVIDRDFDTAFAILGGVALLLFVLTRHKLAYIAAALGWVSFRMMVGFFLYKGGLTALALAAVFGAAALWLIIAVEKREQRQYTRRRW